VVEEIEPAMKQGLVMDILKVNRDKALRSREWVKVTERPRGASCGEELMVRPARQKRSEGLKNATKRKVVRRYRGGVMVFYILC
jgi:hypothetical protein